MSKLKALRQARNLTQEEVAKILGVDRSTLAQWENGVNMPRAKMLVKLSKMFKCSIETLLRV